MIVTKKATAFGGGDDDEVPMHSLRIHLRPRQGDPDNGIAPGTSFEDLPDDWVCPECGVDKDLFEPVD